MMKLLFWIPAIGVLLLSCGAGSGDLYDQYFEQPPALPDSVEAGDFLFKEGMQAYRNGEFLPALSFFMQVDPASISVDTVSFYIGTTELALDNHARALGFLEAAAAVSDSPMKADMLWYTALAQIKLSRENLARRTLEKLRNIDDEMYREHATTLLEALGQ